MTTTKYDHHQYSESIQLAVKIRNHKKVFMITSCILLHFLVIITLIQCQELNNKNNQTNLGDNKNTNLSALVLNESSTTSSEVIISGDEFVDFTEAPILLFDGTPNDSSNKTTTTSAPSSTSEFSENSTSITETISDIPTTVIPTTPEEVIDEEVGPEEVEDDENSSLNNNKEEENNFEPPKNVSQYMDYIERLFHDLRHQITDLFEPHIPQLIRTSQMVQLSSSCSYDMLKLALALRQFEPWALKMIDSSGKVPEGIFEGSFTALGSYDECLSTNFGGSSSSSSSMTTTTEGSSQKLSQTTQGKYCLVNLSPFMPPKPPADKVERMFQEEANRRNYTKVIITDKSKLIIL